MFPHDITVYRNEGGQWRSYRVRGVLWQDTEEVNVTKSGLKDVNSLKLYIPFSCGFKPKKKDMVIKSLINYEIKNKPSELYSIGDVRTITTVDAFDFGSLKHYEAGGR